MANDAPTHPIELHELFAKPTSKDVAQRMLQMITGYWLTQIVHAVTKYSIADELARGPRLNASMMLRLTGGRVRGKSLNENQEDKNKAKGRKRGSREGRRQRLTSCSTDSSRLPEPNSQLS
jgi:hypothetical protein